MSKKKKVVLGVVFVVLLALVWVGTYYFWLSVEPKGDSVITSEELEELDNRDSIYYDATVVINEEEYSLDSLTKDIIGETVVVDVKVNDREVQGYVTFSDTCDKAQVVLADEDVYAQIILPEEVE